MIISNRTAFMEAVRKGVLVGSILDLHFPEGNGLFAIDVADLTRLLERNHQHGLEVLKMRHVDIQGGELQMRRFLSCLKKQRNLRSFQAEFCNFSYRIAMVVFGLPSLETLNIVGHKGLRWRRPLPVTMVTQWVQKQGHLLRDLRLDGLSNFQDQSAQQLFQEVAKSRLEVFWCLASNFGNAEVEMVANLLQKSTTSLRDIRFSIAVDKNVTNLSLIAESLQNNTTLTHLGIRVSGEQDPTTQDMECFLDLLQNNNNYTLQDLILARQTQWDADQRRHIPVYSDDQASKVYKKIDYYLALNRAGRGALLLDTATGEHWLATIASQWDLSILFYFTRMNPTLILGGVPPPSEATRVRDESVLLKRCSTKFPDVGRNATLTLLGPRQVQDALMCLPHNNSVSIKHLSIRFAADSKLNWIDLAALIGHPAAGPTLETILVEGVQLQGHHPELLLQALSNANHLIHLSIRNCKCNNMTDAGELTRVLANLPNFESLGWTRNQEASLCFGDINQLLRNRPIKFLALDNVVVEKENCTSEGGLDEFFRLIEQSTSLKVLRCETHPRGVSTCHLTQLASALSVNRSLENLQIHVTPNVDVTPLAESLRRNQTLTGLHITGLDDDDDDDDTSNSSSFPATTTNLSAFCSVLEKDNSTLKSLLIGKHDLCAVVVTATGATNGGVSPPTMIATNTTTSTRSADRLMEKSTMNRIGQLLRANIARARPLPLPRACYNPA